MDKQANMIATEIPVEQGSQEWLDLRTGLITGSRFKDVLATIKNGEAIARARYRSEIALERLTGQMVERYKSKAMDWGSDTEELAAVEYSLATGLIVETCGFYKHNSHQIGVSPDRKIKGLNGCVEIKCPELYNHYKALKSDHMPPEHMAQVQGEIWFTGSDFCDFVSFAPELPNNAQLFIERIYRDDDYIKMLEAELLKFQIEVEEEVRFIQTYERQPSGS